MKTAILKISDMLRNASAQNETASNTKWGLYAIYALGFCIILLQLRSLL